MKTQREIKFRVWDESDKQMVSWEDCIDTPLLFDAFDFDNAIPQQYTGLKDVCGIEIYEGDIMYRKAVDIYYRCEYSQEEGAYVLIFERDTDFVYLSQHAKYIEIVGNMFENPELMK